MENIIWYNRSTICLQTGNEYYINSQVKKEYWISAGLVTHRA